MAAFSPNLCRFNSPPISPFPHTPKTSHRIRTNTVRATANSEKKTSKPSEEEDSTRTTSTQSKLPKKPIYSMKKGQIVRVDKEKYLNSINVILRVLVGHPPYYKGLDYIYEDRGEVLDLRIFETGEYALGLSILSHAEKFVLPPTE
ncbi:hypothetical protein Syun_013951 [Stephania yunnanensis]|uniref:Uncharacterized protein n=1 Tax=Stephania yunnanensis TaxID=152371 RepID=A0AAP0PBF3_9MAGN